MAQETKNFDPQAKSGELNSARVADSAQRRLARREEQGRKAEQNTPKKDLSGRSQLANVEKEEGNKPAENHQKPDRIQELAEPPTKGGIVARFKSARQANARAESKQLNNLKGSIDQLKKDQPDFYKSANKKIKNENKVEDGMQMSRRGRRKSYEKASKLKANLLKKLDDQIKKGASSGWIPMVMLAMLTDLAGFLIGIISLPPLPTAFIGPFLATAVGAAFGIFFAIFLWRKGDYLFKSNMKGSGPLMLMEAVPFLSALPAFTTSTLLAWVRTRKKINELKEARKKLAGKDDDSKK